MGGLNYVLKDSTQDVDSPSKNNSHRNFFYGILFTFMTTFAVLGYSEINFGTFNPLDLEARKRRNNLEERYFKLHEELVRKVDENGNFIIDLKSEEHAFKREIDYLDNEMITVNSSVRSMHFKVLSDLVNRMENVVGNSLNQ